MERPNPLGEVASKVGVAWAGLAGLVSALITFGVLTSAQGDAIAQAGAAAPSTITALGTIIAGIMPIIGGLVSAFRTASAGRDHVTPVSDPRDNSGAALVPEVPVNQQPAPADGYVSPWSAPSAQDSQG